MKSGEVESMDAKKFLRKIKYTLKDYGVVFKLFFQTLYANAFFRKRYAYIFMTPKGGNLGDQALLLAECELLSDLYLIEMPCTDSKIYMRYISFVKRIIGNKVLLGQAGGNLGTLWYNPAEKALREFIVNFPNNPIILLPNTCYYEDSAWGTEEFEKSKEIYNAHKSLKIFLREKISYDLVKTAYNDTALMPDMVMFLNVTPYTAKRDGALLCLRSDVEKTMSDASYNVALQWLRDRFSNVRITDTVISNYVRKRERKQRFMEKLAEFQAAKLVVTDRLHGMIFAAITATPCIVLQSKSHKIAGCYEWIKHLPYIKLVENINDVEDIETFVTKEYSYDNSNLLHYFDMLQETVYNAVNECGY